MAAGRSRSSATSALTTAGGSSEGDVFTFGGRDLGLKVSAKPAGAGLAIAVEPSSTPAIHSLVVATWKPICAALHASAAGRFSADPGGNSRACRQVRCGPSGSGRESWRRDLRTCDLRGFAWNSRFQISDCRSVRPILESRVRVSVNLKTPILNLKSQILNLIVSCKVVEYHDHPYDLEQGALEFNTSRSSLASSRARKPPPKSSGGSTGAITSSCWRMHRSPTIRAASSGVVQGRARDPGPRILGQQARRPGVAAGSHVEFTGRRVLYTWIGGTRRDWRGQGHFRA